MSLFIANGAGSHIAIDPYQSYFHDIGIHQPEKVKMMGSFQWICEKSVTAIADLSRRGEVFDFIFIDAFVDFNSQSQSFPRTVPLP